MNDSKKMADAVKKVFARLSTLSSEELHSRVQKHRNSELTGLLIGKAYANSSEAAKAFEVSEKYDIDVMVPVATAYVTTNKISGSYITTDAVKAYSWTGVSGTFIVSGSLKIDANCNTEETVTWPTAA